MTDEALNVVIENKDVIAWTRIKEQAEADIKTSERMSLLNVEIIRVAEEQIAKYKGEE